MADPKKSVYARLASRFAHLALGAKEKDEEEDKKEGRAEEEPEAAEEPKEEKKGKKAKKSKEPCSDEEDGDGPDAAEGEEDDEDDEDDKEEGKKARASERARWAAVLSSAEAKGRVPLACSLLADTDMTEDTIRSALLASPAEGRQGLAARMSTVERPDVGSGPAAAPKPGTTSARVAEMRAAYDQALGR